MTRWLLILPLVVAPLVVTGCGKRVRTITVRVTIPTDGPASPAAPLAGVQVVALPYDRDSVRAALERAAPTPRPSTAGVDSLFARFREPFSAYARASLRADRLRDSAAVLTERLGAAAYADSMKAAERRRDSTQAALDAVRRAVGDRMDSLRAPIRSWENSTFRDWDSVTRALAQTRGKPAADTTDAQGWAHLEVRPDRQWWIYATSFDVEDPNGQWYWNIPVQSDTVFLDASTGRRRPRY